MGPEGGEGSFLIGCLALGHSTHRITWLGRGCGRILLPVFGKACTCTDTQISIFHYGVPKASQHEAGTYVSGVCLAVTDPDITRSKPALAYLLSDAGGNAGSFCSNILSISAFILLASRSLEDENAKDRIYRGKEDCVFPFIKKAKNPPTFFHCSLPLRPHCPTLDHMTVPSYKGGQESRKWDFRVWHRAVVLKLGPLLRDSDSVGLGCGLTLEFITCSKNLG